MFYQSELLGLDESYVSAMILLTRHESLGEVAVTGVVNSVLLSLLTGVCLALVCSNITIKLIADEAYPSDPLLFRGLVMIMLLHVCVITILVISGTANVIHAPSMAASYLPSSRISAGALFVVADIQHLTQLFFSHRAYLLSGRNKGILAVCCTMSIATFGASLANCVVAFELPRINSQTTKVEFDAQFGPELYLHLLRSLPFGIVWMVMTLATDVTITGILLYCLIKTKAAFSNTQSAIKKLMLTITEAMLPPFLCAVLTAGLVLGGYAKLGLVLFPLGANFYHIAVTGHLLARGKVRSILDGTSMHHWPAGTKPAVTNLGSFPYEHNGVGTDVRQSSGAKCTCTYDQSPHGKARDIFMADGISEDYKGFDNGSQPTLGPIVAELDHDGAMRVPRNNRKSS